MLTNNVNVTRVQVIQRGNSIQERLTYTNFKRGERVTKRELLRNGKVYKGTDYVYSRGKLQKKFNYNITPTGQTIKTNTVRSPNAVRQSVKNTQFKTNVNAAKLQAQQNKLNKIKQLNQIKNNNRVVGKNPINTKAIKIGPSGNIGRKYTISQIISKPSLITGKRSKAIYNADMGLKLLRAKGYAAKEAARVNNLLIIAEANKKGFKGSKKINNNSRDITIKGVSDDAKKFLENIYKKKIIDSINTKQRLKNLSILKLSKQDVINNLKNSVSENIFKRISPVVNKLTKEELYSNLTKRKKDFIEDLKFPTKRLNAWRILKIPNIKVLVWRDQVIRPKTKKEEQFYLRLFKVIERDEKLKQQFSNAIKAGNLNINDFDKWYTKAIKGIGISGVSTLFTGGFLGNILDKIGIFTNARLVGGDVSLRAEIEKERAKGLTLSEVKASLDPRKPENWANIVLAVSGVAFVKYGGFLKFLARKNRKFVPSIRNVKEMRTAIKDRINKIRVARKAAKGNIKAKYQVKFSKRLLNKLDAAEAALKKSDIVLSRIEKDPGVLKLNDFQPHVKSAKLLKEIGKDKTLFHVTSTPIKDLFGQKSLKLKSLAEIETAVKLSSGKPLRKLVTKSKLEKSVLKIVEKLNGVVTGGRAQNVFVKKILRRKSIDFDILIKNPSKSADFALKQLKKEFPLKSFQLKILKSKGGFKVYRIIADGINLIDFDPISKVKGLKPIKFGRNRVANPEFLAKQKTKTLFDPNFKYRAIKDKKDLRRLVGDFFSDNKFIKKLKDPRNMFTVRSRPKNMGIDRIKFDETHFYFDVEVATGYAYQSLVKNIFPEKLINFAKDIGVRDTFLRLLNKKKFIKSNPKFTVLRLKQKISAYPKKLSLRMKKAAKGSLSSKEAIKLRKDINVYIKQNPNKVFTGPKATGYGFGESEFVISLDSLVKRKPVITKRISIDPDTNVLFDIIDISLPKAKQIKPSIKKLLKNAIKEFKKDPLRVIKRNFIPEDAAKLRRLNSRLKKADKLTDASYLDLLEITKKLFKNKKAKAQLSKEIKRFKSTLTPTQRRKIFIKSRNAVKLKSESIKNIGLSRNKNKLQNNKRRSINKVKSRKTVRQSTRPRKTTRQPTLPRKTTRQPTRPRKTTRQPTRPRKTTRQPTRPRKTLRQPKRPRKTVRQPTRPRQRIILSTYTTTLIRKIKKIKTVKNKKKEEENIIKWIKNQPNLYQPSLVAIFFNITGKLPKKISGIDLRPIIK